jgi:putative sterol carrier protein
MDSLAQDKIKSKINYIFQVMPELFIGEKAEGVNGAYQIVFTDIDYPWHTLVEGANCTSHLGIHPNPAVIMSVSSSDFADITFGKLNETIALMKGKIKIKGNLVQAVKYSKLFYKISS